MRGLCGPGDRPHPADLGVEPVQELRTGHRHGGGRSREAVHPLRPVPCPGVVRQGHRGHGPGHRRHALEQLGVRGKVLKAGVGDKLAGDAEVGKLHRLIAVKIARKFHIRHGRCLLLGMKKTRLSNRVFFWMFDFVTKERI